MNSLRGCFNMASRMIDGKFLKDLKPGGILLTQQKIFNKIGKEYAKRFSHFYISMVPDLFRCLWERVYPQEDGKVFCV
jgi:hypothetical protein